jgi:hypothetical protein
MNETNDIRIERAVVELWDDTAKTKRVFEIVPERGEKDVGLLLTIDTDSVPDGTDRTGTFLRYRPGDKHIDMHLMGLLA